MDYEKIGGVVLIFLMLGGIGFFLISKLSENTNNLSPANYNSRDLISQSDLSQSPVNTVTESGQPPRDLPLQKVKKLDKFPGILKPEFLQNKKAVILTNKGKIELEIYPEASMSASNFILLAANGFYNGLIFHRVEPGFVIQGGDPNGDGTGGPGYKFPDEPVTRDYKKGIVAMANSGPDTNGSQFFIILEDHPELPRKYTIFGNVISGTDTVSKISVGDIMQRVVIQDLH